MKYALLIYPGRPPEEFERLPEEEQRSIVREYLALAQEPGVLGAEQLQPPESATTVRVEDGKTLMTDGPFADTKEILGGVLPARGGQPRSGARVGRTDSGGAAGWRRRGAAAGGAVALLEQVFREEWGRVLANLIGFLGDFDLAEEAAQEAFAIAAGRWPRTGEPVNPGAWLTTTARNRAIDRIRRDRTLVAKTRLLDLPEAVEEMVEQAFPDERLELIFTCCHPALALDAQVALTLRTLGGLTTGEIARAFLVPAETMKRRLTRAKDKIKTAGIPFSVPADHLLPDRLAAVLAVVYLIFNEGYGGRVDLAAEAIRLGRMLASLMPDEPEVRGLLALLLLHDSRRGARFVGGELVLLEDQDRSLMGPGQIGEGRGLLDQAIALHGRGPTCSRRRSPRCKPTIRSTGPRSRRSTASSPA